MTHSLDIGQQPVTGAPRQGGAPPLPRTDVPASLTDKMALAEQLAMAQGSLFPDWLRGRSANFLAVMFAAQALDIPLWTACQGLYAEGGSVGVEASLMRGLVQRAGHLIYTEESSPFHATVVVVRWNVPDRPYRKTFTIEEAARMGLAGLDHYQRAPEAQMVARATSAVCREACADALAGFVYTPEELQHGFRQDKTPAAPPPADVDAATIDKLCAEITAASTLVEIKKAWKATAKAGAMTASCDGEALVSKLQSKLAEIAPGTALPVTTIATPADTATTAATAAPAPSDTPAGEPATEKAPCGCPLARFTETGTHAEDCREYTAPVPIGLHAPTQKPSAAKRAPRKAATKKAPGK